MNGVESARNQDLKARLDRCMRRRAELHQQNDELKKRVSESVAFLQFVRGLMDVTVEPGSADDTPLQRVARRAEKLWHERRVAVQPSKTDFGK